MSSNAEKNLWSMIDQEHTNVKTLSDLKCGERKFKVTITTHALGLEMKPNEGEKFQDFYFITQSAYIDPQNCYIRDSSDERGWYASQYEISLYPVVGEIREDDEETVQILKASPENVVGGETATVGTSFSLGANGGFFGSVPTGGASGGYHVSNSYSFRKPDVEIVNHADFRRIKWTFNMNNIEWEKGIVSKGTVKKPKELQIASFQPIMTSIWRLTTRDPDRTLYGRGIYFETEFKAKMECARIQRYANDKRMNLPLTGAPSPFDLTRKYIGAAIDEIIGKLAKTEIGKSTFEKLPHFYERLVTEQMQCEQKYRYPVRPICFTKRRSK